MRTPKTAMTRRLPRASKVLGAASIALAVVAFGLWWAGRARVAGPSGVGPRVATTLATILAGIAVWALADLATSSQRRLVERLLAGSVAVLGASTLLRPLLDPSSALGFALLGTALLAIDRRTSRGHRPSEWLALSSLLIGLVAVTDFLYEPAGQAALYRQMPLHTAVALMALALGTLFARPHDGSIMGVVGAPAVGGALARRLLPAILLVPVAVGWLRVRGESVGLFDTAFGSALMVTATIVLLMGGVLWTASSLNRTDRHRQTLEEERARIQDQLRRTNELLDAIIENIPLMIFMKEAERLTFVRFNRAGERLLGLDRQALLGKTDFDFFPPEQARHFQAKDRETLAGQEIIDLEEPINSPSGRRWLHTKKVTLRASDGTPAFLLGISEDITLRKQHEEELRAALINAENNSRELEAFSYSVSHDLRGPLRSIDGFSQALLEDHAEHLNEEARSHLARVRGAAQRMAQLIDELLDLSRVTRLELHRERVDLSAVAREVGQELAAREPTRAVHLLVADGLQVDADPRLMRVLFENLLGNAWKFTGRRPAATIEVGRADENGTAHFFVRDDGAGFDMTYADKLFGAFQRLHRESEFEGTGIGLATVHRIIDRHRGRVWAEGEVGRGATIFFTLQREPPAS
jgi:PAS domain S-box-containing protein